MLGWSINLFRLFGIRLAVHFTFLLLLAYVAWAGWMDGGWPGVGWSLVFVALLFTCIVLHELGHSLTARRFGIGVPRILLLPIGGMAEFESIPRQPRSELLITLAGPAVNFTIVLLLLPLVSLPHLWSDPDIEVSFRGLGQVLLWINLIMGTFNLLPVFPMDGGRILRSLLAMRLPYLKATAWAAGIAKVLGGIAIVVALFKDAPLAALLFAFILVAGDLEYRAVRRREEENAQWQLLIRRLYAPPGDDGRETTVQALHGPN
jgi:Zn-dependent protease